ncbi:MAG: O-antigen ligase family protein [Cyanobacteria bacterium P01_A01_bin.123]
MAHTKSFSILTLANQYRFLSGLVLVSLVLLPYVIYLGLAGLTLFMGLVIYRNGPAVRSQLWHQGFVLLAVLLSFNAVWASFRGEALLQLANFLPFFVLFTTFCVFLGEAKSPVVTLDRWAMGLLLATVPINLLAGVEYWLRSPAMMAKLAQSDRWQDFYQRHYGHRAYMMFHHPNIMACFLIMVFGLVLGLVLHRLNQHRSGQPLGTRREWLGIGAALALVLAGIFFAGSRNGILIVAIQIVCFGLIARRHRFVAIAGLGSVITLVLVVGVMGIGGRTVSLGIFTHDPRVLVWQFAWDYMQQRPLSGWGLGSYKLMYVPDSVPNYANINHAHNFWITLAAEAGLPTTLAFTGIIGRLCYRGVRGIIQPIKAIAGNGVFIGYGLAFLGICLFCLFDVPIFDARINILGWLSLAGLYAAGQQLNLAQE